MAFSDPALRDCPHCTRSTPHRLVADRHGEVAWCQVCYHVSAVSCAATEDEPVRGRRASFYRQSV